MLHIVADEQIPFLKGIFEPFAEIVYKPGAAITNADVIHADALVIRTVTKCDENLLGGTRVKFIGTATIGFDHIDTAYCKDHSISWINAPGCNAGSVLQYTIAALLQIATTNKFTLQGLTIGIVGVGHIGKLVERFARLIGMNVLLNDPPRARKEGQEHFMSFDHLLEFSDILTLHVPLIKTGQDATWHLLNTDSIAKMKPGSWLMNTARGEVAETMALKNAIISGKFKGVVLDVWENEPRVDQNLLSLASVATPHVAGYSTDGKANGTTRVVRGLADFFNLPVRGWSPVAVPEPQNPLIMLDCTGKTNEEILQGAVVQTYSVVHDDQLFRSDPGNFEAQRGNYPPRREFPAFQVAIRNSRQEITTILRALGFSVIPGK